MQNNSEDLIALPCVICGTPLYENDNGYRVLKAIVNSSSVHYDLIKNCIPEQWRNSSNYKNGDFKLTLKSDTKPLPDVVYIFLGKLCSHKKYGMQFQAIDFYCDEPIDYVMMKDYLCRLPNVGPVRAAFMMKEFGLEKIADVIENRIYEIIDKVPGINKERAKTLQDRWNKERNTRNVYMWLIKHSISPIFGKKIIETFGEGAIKILQENPYSLTQIRGIGFLKADEIAHKILEEVPKDMRVKACIHYTLNEKRGSGHVCFPVNNLRREVYDFLSVEKDQEYIEEINNSIKNNFVLLKDNVEKQIYIYTPKMFYCEIENSFFLYEMQDITSNFTCSDEEIDYAEDRCSLFNSKSVSIKFDENQKEAIRSAFENKLTVLTGGGGTGKSTICHAICSIANEKGIGVTLFAPTGQAAKVLSNKTGMEATTIHRGLGLLPFGTPNIDNDRDNGISTSILIIDEFSMVGTDILSCVFEAVNNMNRTNIVFVGDPQQLPSVSPGNNLRDIIECGCANVVKLNRIYRQSENSYITVLADGISKGKPADIPDNADDLFWHEVSSVDDAIDVFCKFLEDYKSIEDIKKIQMISPQNREECSVNHINNIIQDKYTKNDDHYLLMDFKSFYLHDRVMQIKNNYEKNVFNGNVGYVIDIGCKVIDPKVNDQDSAFMIVDFEGRVVNYIGEEIDELKVAWCSTVHKFQGSQMDHVLFFMLGRHRHMMSRELVYTALTRAKDRIDIIGTESLIKYCASRSEINRRYTNLSGLYKKFINGNKDIEIFMSKELLTEGLKAKLEQN